MPFKSHLRSTESDYGIGSTVDHCIIRCLPPRTGAGRVLSASSSDAIFDGIREFGKDSLSRTRRSSTSWRSAYRFVTEHVAIDDVSVNRVGDRHFDADTHCDAMAVAPPLWYTRASPSHSIHQTVCIGTDRVRGTSTLRGLLRRTSQRMKLSSASPQHDQPKSRPRGIGALGVFFLFGAAMSSLAAASLLFPGGLLDPIWILNPRAREAFIGTAPWGSMLLLVLSCACALAACGLFCARRWGHRLALTLLAINLIGDIVNVTLGIEPRAWIGIPIVLSIFWYLLSRRVRQCFK